MNIVLYCGIALALDAMIFGIILKRDRKRLVSKIKQLMHQCGNDTITEGEISSWLD